MASRKLRNPDSVSGDWYIDTRCIDCLASAVVAPDLIHEAVEESVIPP